MLKGKASPSDVHYGIIFLEGKLPPNSGQLLFGLFGKIVFLNLFF